MKTTLNVALLALCLGLCVLRVEGHKGEAFQAAAHLAVGLLIGLAVRRPRRLYLILAAGMSAVEVLVFLLGRTS